MNIKILGLIIGIIWFSLACKKDSELNSSSAKQDVILTTDKTLQINPTDAIIQFTISDKGSLKILVSGIAWGKSPSPTILTNVVTQSDTGKGTFTIQITSLKPNEKIYARAFATTEKGTKYGNEISFTTANTKELPTLTTVKTLEINPTDATIQFTVSDEGSFAVTSVGVAWSRIPGPTVANNFLPASGFGKGTFDVKITGLNRNEKIYVKAYATNLKGTEYGNEISFTTTNPAITFISGCWASNSMGAHGLGFDINCSEPGVIPITAGVLASDIMGAVLEYPADIFFEYNFSSFPINQIFTRAGYIPSNYKFYIKTNVGVQILED